MLVFMKMSRPHSFLGTEREKTAKKESRRDGTYRSVVPFSRSGDNKTDIMKFASNAGIWKLSLKYPKDNDLKGGMALCGISRRLYWPIVYLGNLTR